MFADTPASPAANIHEQVLGTWLPQVRPSTSVATRESAPVGPRRQGLPEAELTGSNPMQRHSWRLQALSDLAPSLAHEFNNLMMIISARTLLVHASSPAPEKIGVHLQAIDQSAERAREMARCLLSLVRPEQTEWTPVDVHALVNESAAMLRRLLPPEVRVRVDLPRHQVVIQGCADMLRQAVLHAAARAWKQVRDGGEFVISLAPPDPQAASLTGGWLRLSFSHEAESSFRRTATPDAEGVHLTAIRCLVAEHGGAVSEQNLPTGRRLDLMLPVRSERGTLAEPPHSPDRWLLLVTSDHRVQQRVAEAIVSTGWSLVTVPSVDSPQPRPELDNLGDQRPSGVIIDLATARPDQLPPQLASACRDLPCLVVGSDRLAHASHASGSFHLGGSAGNSPAGFSAHSAKSASSDRARADANSRRTSADEHAGSRTMWHDQPLDRQVVQRWVDQLTRSGHSAGSAGSPSNNFGALR